MEADTCPTGIVELDKLLSGGIPRGNVVLVAGTPGAGKTTLGAKFIYEGLKRGEPGVYLSFIESKTEFYKFMRLLGFDFFKYEKMSLFKYIEGIQSNTFEGALESLKDFLKAISDIKAKRAVIDSISAMTQMTTFKSARELVRNAIVNGLKPYQITALVIAELPIGREEVGYGIEEFIVDGVIVLRAEYRAGLMRRTLEIRKMRGIAIPEIQIHFDIKPGVGLRLYTPINLTTIEPTKSHDKLLERPSHELAKMMPAKIPVGAQVLLIAEPEVQGSPIATALSLLYASSTQTSKLLIRSFTKSKYDVQTIIDKLLRALNIEKDKVKTYIESINPTSQPIYKLVYLAREREQRIKPDFIIIDSLSQLARLATDVDEFNRILLNDVLVRQIEGITAFYLYQKQEMEEKLLISTEFFDIIIKLSSSSKEQCIKASTMSSYELEASTESSEICLRDLA